MKVQGKFGEYSIDEEVSKKFDLMIKRCSEKNKFDNLVVVDGEEGLGKTTIAILFANYVSQKTGRPFDLENVFFDADEMIEFAAKSDAQIIVWDEAALGGLSIEWSSKVQKKLKKLLMIARKKRHFYFFCIPKFFKLTEYLIVDRAKALIHVYSHDDIHRGRFVYFRKEAKDKLYYDWRKKGARNYKIRYSLRGTFPNAMAKVIDEEAYDKKKDFAIVKALQTEEMNFDKRRLIKLQYKLARPNGKTIVERSIYNEIPLSNMQEWSKLALKYPEILGNEEKTPIQE